MDVILLSVKYYTDKHVPKAISNELHKRGIDVVRCEEVGLGNAADETHLEYATRENRVVITSDEDFTRLHKSWIEQNKSHAGILYYLPHLRGKDKVGIIIQECIFYYEAVASGAASLQEDLENQIIFVS